jgi:flagellar motor component MotA
MHKKLLETLRKHHITYRLEEFGLLINRIVEHAKIIRKDGILSLEKSIEDEKNYLYRKLMGMVMDGIKSHQVQRAGELYISNIEGYLKAREKALRIPESEIETVLRQMRMVVEAVGMIQNEAPPYLMEEVLFLYVLGEARPISRFNKPKD